MEQQVEKLSDKIKLLAVKVDKLAKINGASKETKDKATAALARIVHRSK